MFLSLCFFLANEAKYNFIFLLATFSFYKQAVKLQIFQTENKT